MIKLFDMPRLMYPLVASLMLLTGQSTTSAKEKITWVLAQEPPITYVRDDAYTGYGVKMLRLIQAELPDYDHAMHLGGTYQRATQDVKNGPLKCAVGVMKTPERMDIMSFSTVPVFHFFDIQIVTRKETFESWGRPEKISLNLLLKNKDLILMLSEGRKYTPGLQAILDRHQGTPHIRTTANAQFSETMLRMLQHNRFTYMFAYPEEVSYLTRQMDNMDNIVTIPITESQLFGHSWAVCSKTPQGKDAIAAISRALKKVRQTEEYREAYEAWIGGNLRTLYREKYQTEFLKIGE